MENCSDNVTGNVGDNMKKLLEIIFIFVLCVIIILPSICYADDLGLGNLDDYKGNPGNADKLVSKAEDILGIIQVVGTVISVIMLMVIGIKYMMGSVEEKAEYKETLKPYLIGAFLLFTGTLIPQIIYKLAQNF